MFTRAHTCAALSVIALFAQSAVAWELDGGLQEWDTSPLRPYDVAIGSDGTPYLTYWDIHAPDWPTGKIFTLDPADGSTSVHEAPAEWVDVGFKMIDKTPDGLLWLSDPVGDSIVSFDRAAARSFTRHPLPGSQFNLPASPFSIRVAPDGAVWFTCPDDPALGSFTPGTSADDTGSWRRFPSTASEELPDPPVALAFAEDGTVWFTIRRGPNSSPGLGRLDPTSESIEIWSYPGAMSPYGIEVAGADIWFLDHQYIHGSGTGALVHFDTRAERFEVHEPPSQLSDSHWLTIDPDGVIWFTAYRDSRIGIFAPATGTFDSRALAGENPMGIALRSEGQVWWAETFAPEEGGVGRFSVSVIDPGRFFFWERLKEVMSFRGWPFYPALRDTLPMPWPPIIYGLIVAAGVVLAGLLVGRIIRGSIKRPR
jgi:virginiamycin B lyase